MPLKWTSNQTQAKNTPFKGLDIPALFLNALWLLWKCSEKNLEVGECVGRLMILFNGLRPSFPHFATPANKNSEISEIFRDSIKFSAFFRDSWTLKSTHSVCFQLLLWNLLTFSLKNWENIYLKPEAYDNNSGADSEILERGAWTRKLVLTGMKRPLKMV